MQAQLVVKWDQVVIWLLCVVCVRDKETSKSFNFVLFIFMASVNLSTKEWLTQKWNFDENKFKQIKTSL